jgi:TetR/AcrR family transcriptional regulator, transcriptional repressor for nem operon
MPMNSVSSRERLITAAMRLFQEQGFHATSVAEVLAGAGVQSGSLYHYFAGKTQLLAATLDRHADRFDEAWLAQAWNEIDDPMERVFALLDLYRRALHDSACRFASPIGSLAVELRDPDAPIRNRLIRNFDLWINAVERCLGAAHDDLPPDTDRRALAQFLLAAMEGAVMQARTYRDIAYFDAVVAQLRAYVACLGTAVPIPAHGKNSSLNRARRAPRT